MALIHGVNFLNETLYIQSMSTLSRPFTALCIVNSKDWRSVWFEWISHVIRYQITPYSFYIHHINTYVYPSSAESSLFGHRFTKHGADGWVSLLNAPKGRVFEWSQINRWLDKTRWRLFQIKIDGGVLIN